MDTESEWSSAPWEPLLEPPPYTPSPPLAFVRTRTGQLIDLSHSGEWSEVVHNTFLVAAAPDLYGALARLIDNIETGSYESTGQAVEEARAVLAQARGETA